MFQEFSPKVDFSEETFRRFQKVLQKKKSLDLYSYENKCIKRRIAVRIRARECNSPEEYLKLLAKEKEELELLFNVLTINVSQFFRNPKPLPR